MTYNTACGSPFDDIEEDEEDATSTPCCKTCKYWDQEGQWPGRGLCKIGVKWYTFRQTLATSTCKAWKVRISDVHPESGR